MASQRAKICRRILLLIFGVSAAADFIMDWLFYAENDALATGLVYGPTNPDVVTTLLVFCSIGSVAFVLEILCLIWEFRRSEEGMSRHELATDILSLLIVWFEDFPQMVISLYLAVCREEGISTVQLAKACLAFADNIFRFCLSVFKWVSESKCECKCKSRCQSTCQDFLKKVSFRSIIKFLMGVGAVLELLGAATIFILNNTQRRGDEMVFRTPTTLTEDTYDDSQYFTNVSVLMSMPQYSGAGHLAPGTKDASAHWVQLASVTNIRGSSQNRQPIMFSFQFENNGTDTMKMAVWEKNNSIWPSPKCFVVQLTSGLVSQELNTTCGSKGYFGKSSTEAFVKFRFDPPTGLFRNRIFGQIFFNMKIFENGVCQDVGRYSDDISQTRDNPGTVVMHYYRINPSHSGNQDYLLQTSTAAARFFGNEDLTDVTEAWKTGWGKCQTSGSLGPVLDITMDVKCDRI